MPDDKKSAAPYQSGPSSHWTYSYLTDPTYSPQDQADLAYLNHGKYTPAPISDKSAPLSPELTNMLPKFLQTLVSSGKMPITSGKQTPGPLEQQFVAAVRRHMNPHNIEVYAPNMYNAGVQAHEATHVFQNTRQNPPAIVRGAYDYGGLEKLKGKNINDFSAEQQAQLVEDYYILTKSIQIVSQLQGGTLTPAQAEWAESYQKVAEPILRQLVNQPEYSQKRESGIFNGEGDLPNDKYGRPPQASEHALPPAPVPPGIPPASISGIYSPSDTMGGQPALVEPVKNITSYKKKPKKN